MKLIGRIAAAAVGAGGLVILLAWYLKWPLFVSGASLTKPTAALAVVIIAIALVTSSGRLTAMMGATAFILGAAALLQDLLGVSLGVDTLLPGIEAEGNMLRIAPLTAFSLVALGSAAVAKWLSRTTLSLTLATIAFVVSQIAILGYVFDVSMLYTVGGFPSMPALTATLIAILSIAFLFQTPSVGLVGLLRDGGSAGKLLRPTIPVLIGGPFTLGWLSLTAQRMGLFDPALTVAILVLAMGMVSCAAMWIASLRLRVLDQQRDNALAQVADANSTLELTIDARTRELSEAAVALEALIRLAPVGIVELDADGALLTANEQWLSVSGLSFEQSVGNGWVSALHPDDADQVMTEWQRCVDAGTPSSGTFRFCTPDGSIKAVQVSTAPLRTNGVLIKHLASVTDVTALRAAEQIATAAQARFEAAFVWSPLGTAVVSLDGFVLEANPRLLDLTGRSAGVLNESIESLFMPLEPLSFDPLNAGPHEGSRQRVDRRLRQSGMEDVWVKVSVADILDGQHIGGFLYQLEDITARRLAEDRLEHLAFHDPLTNLPNRRLLLDRLTQALSQAEGLQNGVAVLFIDLDRFKTVNDSLGHLSGDAVLIEVAARLRFVVRQSDTIARIGGDEFVIVCPNIASMDEVKRLSTALQTTLSLPISINGQRARVGVSIGVSFGKANDDAEALLRDADQAMYSAKHGGGARSQLFGNDMREQLEHRLDMEIALRDAVDLNQIETWYQPIVDLRARTVVATEALARWRRPEHDLVLPTGFIAIAEEIGLIQQIGMTVLNQACSAAALEGSIVVSVNVSPRQFANDDFGTVVLRALDQSGLDPHQLWLELTESAVVEAIDSAARTFQHLRSLGVRVAIDDFGAGDSSFSHLRTFEVDLLKVNRSFIQNIETSSHDRAIAEGIIRLADTMHLDVVAEGIETWGQCNLLLDMGCRFGQGYLFSRPSPSVSPVISVCLPS